MRKKKINIHNKGRRGNLIMLDKSTDASCFYCSFTEFVESLKLRLILNLSNSIPKVVFFFVSSLNTIFTLRRSSWLVFLLFLVLYY